MGWSRSRTSHAAETTSSPHEEHEPVVLFQLRPATRGAAGDGERASIQRADAVSLERSRLPRSPSLDDPDARSPNEVHSGACFAAELGAAACWSRPGSCRARDVAPCALAKAAVAIGLVHAYSQLPRPAAGGSVRGPEVWVRIEEAIEFSYIGGVNKLRQLVQYWVCSGPPNAARLAGRLPALPPG